MSKEEVSTELDCQRISVIVHRSDKLPIVHSSCLFGAESYSGQRERKRVSGRVFSEKFVNSCLANSPSVYTYTVKRTLYPPLRLTSVFWSITFKTTSPRMSRRNAKEYRSMTAQ